MKLTIDTKQLRATLNLMASMPVTTGPSPVLLKADEFGGLILRRTSHLATMILGCEASVEEDGESIIGFDAVHSLLSKLSSEKLIISSDKSKLNFKAGSSTAGLVLWPPDDDHQERPEVNGIALTFDSLKLADWLEVCKATAHNGAGRDNMKGVSIRTCLDRITMVGSDGRRLNACFGDEAFEPVLPSNGTDGQKEGFDSGILISKEVVECVLKMIDKYQCAARLKVSANGAQFEIAGRVLRFAIPVETPPNMTPFLSGDPFMFHFTVERARLLDVAKVAAPMGAGDHHAITLYPGDKALKVEADDTRGNFFSDTLECSSTRKNVGLRVNAKFLAEFLDGSASEKVTIGYLKPYHALCIREEDRQLMLMLIRDNTIPDSLQP